MECMFVAWRQSRKLLRQSIFMTQGASLWHVYEVFNHMAVRKMKNINRAIRGEQDESSDLLSA